MDHFSDLCLCVPVVSSLLPDNSGSGHKDGRSGPACAGPGSKGLELVILEALQVEEVARFFSFLHLAYVAGFAVGLDSKTEEKNNH